MKREAPPADHEGMVYVSESDFMMLQQIEQLEEAASRLRLQLNQNQQQQRR